MKTQDKCCFLICPVRNANTKQVESIVGQLEENGWKVHWPPRDTDQKDNIGLRICEDNLKAIGDADIVFIIWDGKSQGCLFDAGMAFALNKNVVCLDLPPATPKKSFQNMFSKWEKETCPGCSNVTNPSTGFTVLMSEIMKTNMSAEYHAKRRMVESKLKAIENDND